MRNVIHGFCGGLAMLGCSASGALSADVFTQGVEISNGPAEDFALEVSGNGSMVGRLCVGYSCGFALPYTSDTVLYLSASNGQPWMEFRNTLVAGGGGQPGRDWRLRVNDDYTGGIARFSIEDLDAGTIPLTVEGAAPQDAFRLAASGNIGFGTSLPQQDLHVVSGLAPGIRLEQDTSGGFGNHRWDIASSDFGLVFSDVGILSTTPFVIQNGARHSGLVLASNGNTGLGTASPAAALHLMRNNGTAQMRVEDTASSQAARALIALENHGRPDIIMANTATGGEWAFGAGTNFVLKTGAVGSSDGDKTRHLRLYGATGDLEITGQIITGGGNCGGGCDRVFTEEAIIPARDYAARMWADGHLPHVGPTPEGAPINVSEKLGGMLNALEHAHVFIEAQNARIETLEADRAAQDARIARLEAQLAAFTAMQPARD